MGRYLCVRLAWSVVLVFVVTVFVFVAFFVLPPTQQGRFFIQQDTYRIHGSMVGQYAHYVWRIFGHGDLGRSYSDREAVTTRLLRAAPVTLSLVVGGFVVSLLVAAALSALAALRPR